jgi:heme/copper-type cytochrome/quinol oxidase subunit 3
MSFERPMATNRSTTGISTCKLGVYWVIGSEIVIFGGLLACYLMFRLAHGSWSHESAHTNVVAGGTNTLVLLTSSLFIVLAHQAAEKRDSKKAFKFIWLTIGGAMTFLTIKFFEWRHEIMEGLTIHKSLFWAFYYTAAGIHAFHVICGAIIMAIVANDVKKNQNLQRVEAIGLYWHFVDIVWIFLFPLLYIAK